MESGAGGLTCGIFFNTIYPHLFKKKCGLKKCVGGGVIFLRCPQKEIHPKKYESEKRQKY